jgi:hypothetical protein
MPEAILDNNHSPQELLNLWKKGKTFNEALHQFTDLKIWREYDEITSSKNSENKGPSENDIQNFSSFLMNSLSDLNKITAHSREVNNAFDQLKLNLLNKIIAEKLIGLAYQAPVKPLDNPQIIPLHMWPRYINEINWDDCSFLQGETHFLNIRIIKKLNTKKSISSPIFKLQKSKIIDKEIGRPSHNGKIIAAYEYLKKENKIDYSKFFKSHTQIIRESVWTLYSNLKGKSEGLGDEAIRRYAKPLFDADKKKTSKPTSKL